MKNIKARVMAILEKQPALGVYIALAGAVKGQEFTRYAISKNMNELLVLGVDYQKEDRKHLLQHLYELSQKAEGPKKRARSLSVASSNSKGMVSIINKK